MSRSVFSGQYRSPTEIINELEIKGLRVNDRAKAEKFLSYINYHRFKVYIHMFKDRTNPITYLQDRSFDEGISLYRFDDELRGYAFALIGRLEIKLRSRLDHVISSFTNNPFWYLDCSLFDYQDNQIKNTHTKTISQLSNYFKKSKDDYPKHYKKKYYNTWDNHNRDLPPFWAIAELMTFGNMKKIYESLNKKKFQSQRVKNNNELDQLADDFGAKNLKELNNWINLINDVRNKCAHHSRVWNSNIRNPSNISKLLTIQPRMNRIYLFLALIHYLSKQIGIGTNVKNCVIDLFNRYPIAKRYCTSAGFPIDWETDPFWA